MNESVHGVRVPKIPVNRLPQRSPNIDESRHCTLSITLLAVGKKKKEERRDEPIAIPPKSSKLLTPKLPKLSILPYPFGNLSVGFFNANATVPNVMKSETRSVKAWKASAT